MTSGLTSVPEIREGLRSTLFRRMSSIAAAAVADATMLLIILIRHPGRGLLVWVLLGLSLEVARICLIVMLGRAIADGSLSRRHGLVDIFVASSLIWGLQFGLSCFLCMSSADLVMVVLSVVFGVGVIGVLSARNPGSPRLTGTVMMLILMPLTAGVLVNPDPGLRLLALLSIPYLWAMWSISAQLHGDYVAMLTAQWENRHRALHCGLTGLPNASHFHERLGVAIASLGEQQISVLTLDLDGFKGVNDRYGHPAGDALLKLVADRIRSVQGPAVMGARIGGDEFAVLLQGHDAGAPELLAERLIVEISRPYCLADAIVTVETSVGIATCRAGTTDSIALYAQADRALYRAKKDGKGTWRRQDEDRSAAEAGPSTVHAAAGCGPDDSPACPESGRLGEDRTVRAA